MKIVTQKQEIAMQTNNKEFRLALTRQETARALGVTPITVDRLVARGLLRPCRALRRPLFPLPEIERFLKETSAEWTQATARPSRSLDMPAKFLLVLSP